MRAYVHTETFIIIISLNADELDIDFVEVQEKKTIVACTHVVYGRQHHNDSRAKRSTSSEWCTVQYGIHTRT